ncbi:MAG: hypothetical protein KC613_24805, partial [Myxococcales bacterium]|nr:hypothetical protein [Myxococcales bacterium]
TSPGDDDTGPAAEPVARDYAAGPLRWLTALPPDGGPQAWLVATGDTHTLARWRWADDGFEPIEGLPLELEVLADGPGVNREWPIQAPVAPGGWPARVVDAQLQVLLPEGEWWRAPGTRWPLAARLSAYEPLAVTVGHLDGPASRLTLFLHHLGPDGAFWGRPGVDSGELRWALADDQGPAVGAFEAGPFKFPVTWIMRGAENGEVLGDVVSCD